MEGQRHRFVAASIISRVPKHCKGVFVDSINAFESNTVAFLGHLSREFLDFPPLMHFHSVQSDDCLPIKAQNKALRNNLKVPFLARYGQIWNLGPLVEEEVVRCTDFD